MCGQPRLETDSEKGYASMLTLRKPLALQSAKNFIRSTESAAQRILANYALLAVRIAPADMFHLMMTPPHLYLTEGKGITVNRWELTKNQDKKLWLINNMLNRILVCADFPMTYQDSVFVDAVLRRLGVADVQKFVNQITNLKINIQNVSRLTALYQSEQEIGQVFWNNQRKLFFHKKETNAEQGEAPKQEYWLHQIILQRLHTRAIYKEVHDFAKTIHQTQSRIDWNEIQVGEQSVSAQYLLLNEMKNEIMAHSQPLSYNRINSYGFGGSHAVNVWHEQTIGDFVRAVLLNVLAQTYVLRFDTLTRYAKNWYVITDLIYSSAQNTLVRFASWQNRFAHKKEDNIKYGEILQEWQQAEINLLQAAFQTCADSTYQSGGKHYTNTALSHHEGINSADNMRTVTAEMLTRSDVFHHQEKTVIGADERSVRLEKGLQEQLAILNQNNLERVHQLQELGLHETDNQTRRIDMEQARKDVLRAIGSPETAQQEYMRLTEKGKAPDALDNPKLKQILGEETVRAFAQVKRQQEKSGSSADRKAGSTEAFDRLVQDVSAVRRQEEIREIKEKQYVQELETVKSAIRTDGGNEVIQKYDTSVINLEETMGVQIGATQRYIQMQDKTRKHFERIGQAVTLFHRKIQNTLSEEKIEELIRNSRQEEHNSAAVTERLRETQRFTQQTDHNVSQVWQNQVHDTVQTVQTGIDRQLEEISEQVYVKLERRLDAERRRRGM